MSSEIVPLESQNFEHSIQNTILTKFINLSGERNQVNKFNSISRKMSAAFP